MLCLLLYILPCIALATFLLVILYNRKKSDTNEEKAYCTYCIHHSYVYVGWCRPPTGETFSNHRSPNNTVYAKTMKCAERNKNNKCPYYEKIKYNLF